MSNTCCASVSNGSYSIYSHTCYKNAKVERDGKHYCGIHDPVAVKAKRDAKNAACEAEWVARRAQEKAVAAAKAEQKRRADCYDDLLSALDDVSNTFDVESYRPGCMERRIGDKARLAIAKATGAAQ